MNVVRSCDVAVACPCCAFVTLSERAAYEICPICFWEDDGQDDSQADEVWGGPNRDLNLTTARDNFRRFGACSQRAVPFVRPPTAQERARSD